MIHVCCRFVDVCCKVIRLAFCYRLIAECFVGRQLHLWVLRALYDGCIASLVAVLNLSWRSVEDASSVLLVDWMIDWALAMIIMGRTGSASIQH